MADIREHQNNSFSYKVTDERIQEQLDKRSKLNNTVQIGMPFIKVTSTVKVGNDGKGFTLGMHMINKDITYQDIYASREDITSPLVGYTYTESGNVLVYAPENTIAEKINNLTPLKRYTTKNTNFKAIAPPGITSANISVNNAGVISSGELTIAIPTLEQFEALNQYFLLPGVGMVLEWGQQFAPYGEFDTGLTNRNIDDYMFPWYNSNKLDLLLKRLGKREVGLQEIYNKYVYPTNGQYQWQFGRLANFSTKLQTDGSYTTTVKIIGQHQESWAYSIYKTIGPAAGTDDKINPADANSPQKYFTNTGSGKNFKSLLDKVKNSKSGPWKDHVIHIPHGNESEGEPKTAESTQNPGMSEQLFGDSENAYFISWKFFVNVVLNGETDELPGLKNLFKSALGQKNKDALNNIKFLRPYEDDDPYENFIGAHPRLRSTDPSVCIIVNKKAAKLAEEAAKKGETTESFISSDPLLTQFERLGDFYESAKKCKHANTDKGDKGFLSTGVWLNHKTVVQAMITGNTIVEGITALLNRMNIATKGFWNLNIDIQDSISDGKQIDHTIVDLNYKPSAVIQQKNFINKVYTFNKLISTEDGIIQYGSEAIDCNIDLTLPNLLFSQLAIFGFANSEIESLNQQKDERGNVIPTGVVFDDNGKPVNNPMIAGGEDAGQLARITKMYGLQTIKPKDPSSPDLTISLLEYPKEKAKNDSVESSTPGGTQGNTASTKKPSASSVKAPAFNPKLEVSNKDTSQLNTNFLQKVNQLINELKARGITTKIIDTVRTQERQDYLYSKGRTRPGEIVTLTRKSKHIRGLAVDLAIVKSDGSITFEYSDGYDTLQEVANSIQGLKTLGKNDAGHVEYTGTDITPNQPKVAELTDLSPDDTGEEGSEYTVRKFYNLNKIFKYVEPFGDEMIANIAKDANDDSSNPFGAAPGPLTIKVNITLPGINGLRVGELFWIDRIPSIYKLFGAFQIMSLSHAIDISGWKTTITGVYYYLGRSWRTALKQIAGLTSEI